MGNISVKNLNAMFVINHNYRTMQRSMPATNHTIATTNAEMKEI